MNTETINLVIPLEPKCLQAASDYLGDLSVNVEHYDFEQLKADPEYVPTLGELNESIKPDPTKPALEVAPGATVVIGDGSGEPLPPVTDPDTKTIFGDAPAEPLAASAPADGEAPAAPTTTTAIPPTTGAASVEVDSRGLPHDARIYTGKKTKLVKTGEWKRKRGVDEALVIKIEAELRAAMGQQPAAPTEAPPEEPAPPADDMSFADFVVLTTDTANGITPEAVKTACEKHGLSDVIYLAAREDLIPAIRAELGI